MASLLHTRFRRPDSLDNEGAGTHSHMVIDLERRPAESMAKYFTRNGKIITNIVYPRGFVPEVLIPTTLQLTGASRPFLWSFAEHCMHAHPSTVTIGAHVPFPATSSFHIEPPPPCPPLLFAVLSSVKSAPVPNIVQTVAR